MFLEIMNMGSTSFKKHEMEILECTIQIKELKDLKGNFIFNQRNPFHPSQFRACADVKNLLKPILKSEQEKYKIRFEGKSSPNLDHCKSRERRVPKSHRDCSHHFL